MKINWLGTAALAFALGIGGSAVVAQPEQLKEPQLHERNQSARRGQEQPDRGEYTAASLAQQSQDEQRAREAQEAADAKRQSIREELQEQDNRIAGTAEPEGSRISLSSEQREMLKQAAQSSLTVGSTSGGGSGQVRLRGEGWGEGDSPRTVLSERAPHPDPLPVRTTQAGRGSAPW